MAVRPEELRALLWSFAYFFCLLASYYILRPLRDEMGVAGGVRNLQWLFTATFVTMLAAVPLYGALVARLPRRRFIPLVYHFFVANLAIFWLLLALGIERQPWRACSSSGSACSTSSRCRCSGRSWPTSTPPSRPSASTASSPPAAARARSPGPAITIGLAQAIGVVNLLIVAALLLEAAVLCATRLEVTKDGGAGGRGRSSAAARSTA